MHSPSGRAESSTTAKNGCQLSEGGRYAFAVKYAMKPPPGTKRLPKGTPYTGHDTPQKINETCREGRSIIKLVTQTAQSPDLNVNDLSFFASLKSKI